VLAALHAKDLALVEDVWLELGPGMTALTGETGAGKTVLVEALKLLLGERADSGLVRSGAEESLVEGTFIIDGREVLARRRLSAEGRSRCTVDGEMATVATLGDLLGSLVDLHGQHQHQALLSPANHAGYLDRFIGEESTSALAAYRDAFSEWREAEAAARALERGLLDREEKLDRLRFIVADIDSAAPREGEDEQLAALLPKLRHAAKLTSASAAAWDALRREGGPSDTIGEALAALRMGSGLDAELDSLAERLGALDTELDEVAARLRDYAESIEHEPNALDEAERRSQLLSDLARKHGGTLEAVFAVRQEARRDIEALDAGEAGLAEARVRVERAEESLRAAAARSVAIRVQSAAGFAASLREAAADLALANAQFEVSVTESPREAWTADGPSRVEFLFASAAGEPPRPLARIASGGEVSRVMLALKGVLGAADPTPILVFDEIDAGIGGATALAVGRRLARLSQGRQVLVVTHLAQVAAYADTQVSVSKESGGGRPVTSVRTLSGEARVAEIARMLSGGDSATTLAHARELMSSAELDRIPSEHE
jgi:DNA repair protein RecN (Recombination protein N)